MMHQHIISSRFPLKCAEAARGGGAGESWRCGCRAEAGRRPGLLQGLCERLADHGGVGSIRVGGCLDCSGSV